MSPIAVNPYLPNSAEYDVWERWLRVFLGQPAYSQFFDVELQLRIAVGVLHRLSTQISDEHLRHEVQVQLDELLTTGQLLEAAGEHAFAVAVASPGAATHAFTPDRDPSA